MTVLAANPQTLSALLRTGSQAEHTAAENAGFMSELVKGEINANGYGQYLLRYRAVYAALEGAARRLEADPIAAAVIDPSLERLAAIEADLTFWLGADWQGAAWNSPATDAYVARIEQAAEWGGTFLAHHYTRYMGDLSGGQAIGRILARAYDLEGGIGVAFYAFPEIPKPKPFKDGYRERLDALVLSDQERQRILAEVKTVFALNSDIFAELGESLDTYRK
ncbi:MAG: biliverdin-producing heme oxygenase [Nocardioidaceae bacterium]|nr:biliverdin-producing heme oxygenase [Nocardioidaceae bacterium]